MASLKGRASRAAALHRQAAAVVAAAGGALDATRPAPADRREQHDLAERLRAAAALLAPGWLGGPLEAQSAETPLGGPGLPEFVRIGTAQPLDDARFPAIVPLLGTGHLTIDADARDARVSGLIRAVLLRLLAAAPAGSLLVRAVDAAGMGTVFAPFAPLADAGLMPPPVSDRTGLRAVLAEAEQWVRPARPAAARHNRRDRTLLVVIASLPELTEGGDLARIAALAQHGPAAGLHLIVAGWPPPPLTAETTQAPLPRTTMVTLRNPYALISDPPGGSFGSPAPHLPSTGLNSPVFLDEDPPAHLFDRVCQELADRFDARSRLSLRDLLPDDADGSWTEESSAGLATTVGQDGDRPVLLQFNDLTPHWMVGGRSGSGKTAFLVNVLYGLCARYGPAELTLYLLDFKEGVSFAEFVPTDRDQTWLPQARAVGVESDREYGLAVLRDLDAEMTRRSVAYKRAGVTRFAELRERQRLPRLVCVVDEFQVLLAGGDRLAGEAVDLLESLARKGRSYGIHLVLASQTVLGVEALYAKRDAIFGQFPVRVALPGGGEVLEPANDAAAGLPLGTAVVNTAGGLGGPRGATRGHERIVRFPDPHADRAALSALRHRLWEARPPEATPPPVFAGYAEQRLDDDPTYLAALAGRSARPAALVGRTVDVQLSTASFPLDASPGRHLAVLGPDPAGADVLAAAARSLAVQHAPGTVRFVVASLVGDGDSAANGLVAELAGRQEVESVDVAGLTGALGLDRPGYLVVFGMDTVGTDSLPAERLRELLRHGPGRGVHLLSWWRGTRRFAEELGGTAARDDVAGLLFLNVPGTEVSALVGRPVDWQPRPNRALLHDRHTDRTAVIVPFTGPERDA
ncbi:FtsK/SpoIIIE domain-containing protein [Polymorphospora sp. NPDC050346]|uniref:FtsK/SpoIIIE domain-containing protein n=1 Tax=Polymorphospora sp. NPDC050346 TaxID=3155780 RepID=UPI0033FE121E